MMDQLKVLFGVIGIKDMAKKLFPFLRRSFFDSFNEKTEEIGFGGTKADQKVLEHIKNRIIILSEKSSNKLTGDLRFQILESRENNESITELTNRIQTVFSGTRYEAERIARNETITAMKLGQLDAYEQAGVWGRQWIAAMNNKRTCDVCKKLNGQVAKTGEWFKHPITGEDLINDMGHIQCRCSTIAIIDNPDEKEDKDE